VLIKEEEFKETCKSYCNKLLIEAIHEIGLSKLSNRLMIETICLFEELG
jgi:hypothetical protein